MISTDTQVHLVSVLSAIALLAVVNYTGIAADSGLVMGGTVLLFYGLVLGGAHLYLAVRGEGGMVPVETRWRYVGMIAVLLGAGALLLVGAGRSVGPVAVEAVGTAVVVFTLVAYFAVEAVDGYRTATSP